MSGVMTHCFIQAILNKPNLTYFELLNSVRKTILETFASRCLSSKLIDKMLHRNLSQVDFCFFRIIPFSLTLQHYKYKPWVDYVLISLLLSN